MFSLLPPWILTVVRSACLLVEPEPRPLVESDSLAFSLGTCESEYMYTVYI